MQRKRYSGIRITLLPQNTSYKEIREWMTAQRSLTNYASKHLLRLMKESYDIASIVFEKKGHFLAYEVHHNVLLKNTEFREERIRLGLRTSTNERLAAAMAGRFYNGYGQRNGGQKGGKWVYKLPKLPAITRQNKAIHVKDSVLRKFVDGDAISVSSKTFKNGQVLIENVRFELQGLFGKIYEFKGKIPENQVKLLQFLTNKPNVDCNIFFTKNGNLTIVIKVEEEYELAYEPINTLGIDFNKRPDVFVTMSDGSIIKRNLELCSLVEKVHELDDAIHSTKLSRNRQAIRNSWKTARKELSKRLTPIVEEIIAKAQNGKSLLAIDGITQSQNGSFGHAELKDELIKVCRLKNIPFIVVPASHTSSDCAYCLEKTGQYHHVARSNDFEKISCDNCETTYHADINAAKNIAIDGKEIFHKTDSDFPTDKYGRTIRSSRPSSSVTDRKKKKVFIDYDSNDIQF